MAVEQLEAVVNRLRKDDEFRGQYCADPDQALSIYHLSGPELRALKTGDGPELELMGLGDTWDAFVKALCGPHPGP